MKRELEDLLHLSPSPADDPEFWAVDLGVYFPIDALIDEEVIRNILRSLGLGVEPEEEEEEAP